MPDNITLLPLPAYAPELNPMENVWEYLRPNKLSRLVEEMHTWLSETLGRISGGSALAKAIRLRAEALAGIGAVPR